MKNIVELKGVSKTYMLGEVETPVLRNVSLEIKEGEFVSVAGPSGSGKSTMLHIIGALDRPTRGSVRIKGRDISDMDDNELAELRGKTVGFVFQTFNLISRLSAAENVILPMIFADHGYEKKERAEKLLRNVGLEHRLHHKPTQLSGGERQRVAIARALANDPDIIVADEPTGNLDSRTGNSIIKMLVNINKRGRTLIIVTHDAGIAGIAGRKIRLHDGKIR